MSTESSIPSDDCPISSDTGVRLKLLRELAGFSQRELAKRAGVTNSSISTIEQGQVSPSVQSLVRILSAIPISLPDFFAFGVDVNTRELNRLVSPPIHSRTLVLAARSAGTFSVASADLSGVVLSGALTLTLAAGAQTLVTGESFCVSAGQLYRLGNTSNDESRLFICSLFELPI
ncbi:helix-turn-helix domain-containing protein [Cellvibrio sp. PSBB023]|uniref:helix-turn-helix domain-containing protein n=1 Tax=Cellvibrio sp. PSBB023 TaxID=1945512 RepID=UPI0009C208F5|nr:hypothetical protein B0D95_03975 [Cellvibrio sp. PSBB023]